MAGSPKKKRYWTGNRVQLIEHRGKPHILWYENDRPLLRVAKGKSLAEQKAFAQSVDEDMTQGVFVRDSQSFQTVCEAFLDESSEQVKRGRLGLKGRKIGHGRFVELRGHINKHLLQVKLAQSALCKIPMKEIDAATVVQIRAELARYLKGQTANKVIATLGRICIFAIERGDMKSNPVRDVDPLPTEEPRENYTPTADELNRVIENASERYKPIIAFAAMSGLRLGELCALEWGDIDEEGNLKVQRSVYNYEIKTPKTANGLRRIRLSEQAQKLLANWKEVAPKSAYVFPTTEGRMDGHDNWRVRGLHPACEKAGVTKFGWHGLRRFYINSLLDSGVPENHVQKLVGHAVGSNVTAKHYRRIRDEDVLQDGLTVSLPEG
jgi:integrase